MDKEREGGDANMGMDIGNDYEEADDGDDDDDDRNLERGNAEACYGNRGSPWEFAGVDGDAVDATDATSVDADNNPYQNVRRLEIQNKKMKKAG